MALAPTHGPVAPKPATTAERPQGSPQESVTRSGLAASANERGGAESSTDRSARSGETARRPRPIPERDEVARRPRAIPERDEVARTAAPPLEARGTKVRTGSTWPRHPVRSMLRGARAALVDVRDGFVEHPLGATAVFGTIVATCYGLSRTRYPALAWLVPSLALGVSAGQIGSGLHAVGRGRADHGWENVGRGLAGLGMSAVGSAAGSVVGGSRALSAVSFLDDAPTLVAAFHARRGRQAQGSASDVATAPYPAPAVDAVPDADP